MLRYMPLFFCQRFTRSALLIIGDYWSRPKKAGSVNQLMTSYSFSSSFTYFFSCTVTLTLLMRRSSMAITSKV